MARTGERREGALQVETPNAKNQADIDLRLRTTVYRRVHVDLPQPILDAFEV